MTKKDAKTEMNIKKLEDKKWLDCKFIRINPDKKDFDIDIDISIIHNHINKSYHPKNP